MRIEGGTTEKCTQTLLQIRLKKKSECGGHLDVCPCEITRGNRKTSGEDCEGESRQKRHRGSMCLFFSRQPRECVSSAAPLTLSMPEGGQSGVATVTVKKTKKTRWSTLAILDVHTLVTAWWCPDLASITCMVDFWEIYITIQKCTVRMERWT